MSTNPVPGGFLPPEEPEDESVTRTASRWAFVILIALAVYAAAMMTAASLSLFSSTEVP